MRMLDFLAEIQNAKNEHVFRPDALESYSGWRIARYVDEREGLLWELCASGIGKLFVRKATLVKEGNGMFSINFLKDTIRIEG